MSTRSGPAVGDGQRMGPGNSSTPSLLSPTRPFHPHRWVSVLQNSKDEALSNAFHGEPSGGQWSWGTRLDTEPHDLTNMLVAEVKSRPGNDRCCDCGAAGQRWGSFGGRPGDRDSGMEAPTTPLCRPHVAQHQPGRAHLHPVLRCPPGAGRALLPHSIAHLGPPGPLGAAGESGREC